MPTISNDQPTTTVFDKARAFVHFKEAWADDKWIFLPYASPQHCTKQCAPLIGEALIEYTLGTIKPEDDVVFSDFSPVLQVDNFVRISFQYPGTKPTKCWYGVVVDSEIITDRSTSQSGLQRLSCKELGFILNRTKIRSSFVLESSTEWRIGNSVSFNETHEFGSQVIGNRSTNPQHNPNTQPVYAFQQIQSANVKKWSNADIVNYLLYHFASNDMTWNYIPVPDPNANSSTPAVDPLTQMNDIFVAGESSVWDAITQLIDRRKGISFKVDVDETKAIPEINLRCFSECETALQVGDATIPANSNKVDFTYPTSFPQYHGVGNISFRTTSANTWDEITVQGNPIRVTASFSYIDGNLTEGWLSDYLLPYITADDTGMVTSSDDQKNDQYRSQTKYDDVYTKHVVPPTWNWKVNSGADNVAPIPQRDGTVSFDPKVLQDKQPKFWNGQKKFDMHLSLQVGYDYTVNPPVRNVPPSVTPEFLKILVFLWDQEHVCYRLSNKLHAANEDMKNVGCQAVDNQMGISLRCEPNHYMGRNSWHNQSVQPANSAFDPDTDSGSDYTQMIVTATLKTDQRQELRWLNPVQSGQLKHLVLTLPHAEYWYCAPETSVTVDGLGQLQPIDDKNLIIRDDKKLLQTVMAFARAYFGKFRQAIEIPIRNPGLYVKLGSFLTSVNSLDSDESQQVKTCVTSRKIDFVSGTTTISTGFADIDYMNIGKKLHA